MNVLPTTVRPVSRRGFLRFSGAGLAGIGALLAACAPGSAPPATTATSAVPPTAAPAPTSAPTQASVTAAPTLAPTAAPTTAAPVSQPATTVAGVQLPTYVPIDQGPKPDLVSAVPGVNPGYTKFPTDLFQSIADKPGHGGTINILTQSTLPAWTPLDSNPMWQEVNRQIGADLQLSVTVTSDYPAKFSTVMAGGDLPDMTTLWPVASLPQLLKAQFQDLTPYVSGDAIKAYPNLAAIPTYHWKNTVIDGAIYGIPVSRPITGTVMFVNRNLYDRDIGADVTPKSADDWKRILLQLTRPGDNQWGTSSGSTFGGVSPVNWYPEMFGAPNNWRVDGGKVVNMRETEEYKASVGFVRDLWAAGVFHPNARSFSGTEGGAAFLGGQIGLNEGIWAGYNDFWRRGNVIDPKVTVRLIQPFTASGSGDPTYWLGYGGVSGIGVTGLKKASDDRIKELLAILNWLAAPFGSQEALLLEYGIEGPDFSWDENHAPAPTDKGLQDTYVPLKTVMQHPPVLYDPLFPDWATVAQADQEAHFKFGSPNPLQGYYGPTEGSRGPVINQRFVDGVSEIVDGRRPLSDYDAIIKDWLDNGGEQMRGEYEQALARA